MSETAATGEVDISTLVSRRGVMEDNHRWAWFTHRPGDIVICTPPKCGTTWTQTIVATLVFGGEAIDGPILARSPWIEQRLFPPADVAAQLEAQEHRRFVKSHSPADGLPWWEDVSYIVVGRDGRDAMMSFLNHSRKLRPDLMAELAAGAAAEGIELPDGGPPPVEDVHEYVDWWLEHGPFFDIISSYWDRRAQPNVLFVHFNDLKADLDGQMRRIAGFLGIDVDEQRWPAMVHSCTFEAMKADADRVAPFELVFEGGAESFLYKGTNERWRDVLTDDELARYEAKVAEWLSPECAAWVRGEHVAGVSD